MGIAVLGPLTVDGGLHLGRRDRVVLTALAVHPGDVVSADVLADVLWGARVPASWAKIVQGCMVRLRKALGRRSIETSSRGYRLAIPLNEIDAERFERAVERAGLLLATDAERSVTVLSDALLLWRGPPFLEVERWDAARVELTRLEELRKLAEEMYVDASLRSGRHDLVLAKAEALVAEAPLRERRWGLLATAQYQSGQQAGALATVRRLHDVLDRELGLDPGPEIDELEEAMLRQDPALIPTAGLAEPSQDCPYRGLEPYDLDDADLFFGREADVSIGLRKLADTSVLAVVGPSGSGMSSLVRAGIAASLRKDGQEVVVITPGAHPLAALAAAMPGNRPRPALLVDQCEEVFSVCLDPEERAAFLTALTAHCEVAPLIFSYSADRLADVATHEGFARVVERGLHLLTGMSEHQLRTAIEEPARLASLNIEPALIDLLISETSGRPGALPLMSHALAETWQRREGRTLTVAAYRASGGIQGAVAKSAEEVYASLPSAQQLMLRDLLLRLVSPNPSGRSQ